MLDLRKPLGELGRLLFEMRVDGAKRTTRPLDDVDTIANEPDGKTGLQENESRSYSGKRRLDGSATMTSSGTNTSRKETAQVRVPSRAQNSARCSARRPVISVFSSAMTWRPSSQRKITPNT
ncbi:MAG: hypothetical protein ACREFD_02430 [Stellaceae bacterium]